MVTRRGQLGGGFGTRVVGHVEDGLLQRRENKRSGLKTMGRPRMKSYQSCSAGEAGRKGGVPKSQAGDVSRTWVKGGRGGSGGIKTAREEVWLWDGPFERLAGNVRLFRGYEYSRPNGEIWVSEVSSNWAREVRFLVNASPPLLMPVSRFLVILEISEGQGHSGIGP
jgi:hypothetical protein